MVAATVGVYCSRVDASRRIMSPAPSSASTAQATPKAWVDIAM